MVELSGSLDVFYNDQYVLQFHVVPFFISAGSISYINLLQHVNIRQRTFAEHQQTALYESRQQKNDVPELKSESRHVHPSRSIFPNQTEESHCPFFRS